MKVTHLLALSGLGLIGLKLFQKRQSLASAAKDLTTHQEAISSSLTQIKSSLNTLSAGREQLNDLTQDLNYQIRLFQTESQERVAQIKDHLAPTHKEAD